MKILDLLNIYNGAKKIENTVSDLNFPEIGIDGLVEIFQVLKTQKADEIIAEKATLGYRPATARELIIYETTHPNNKVPILALGQKWLSKEDQNFPREDVLIAETRNGNREFNTRFYGLPIDKKYYVAFVKV